MSSESLPPDFRLNRPFVGIPSFLRSRIVTDLQELTAKVAVMGVPFDEGSPFLSGCRMGPRTLREHSLRFAGPVPAIHEPESGRTFLEHELGNGLIADCGDADIWPTDVKRSFENITNMTRGILDRGAMPVVLGGDHSITYPVVRGFSDPIHVVHFDAHIDYAPFIHDLRFTNGHAFRHISPMSHVKNLTQVGIRSLRTVASHVQDSRDDGNRVVTMREFREIGPAGIAEVIPAGAQCYVSIDVDVLDMSLIPGCVSGEPNGMTYAELRNTLVAIAERGDIAGFDFVEVNPMLDVGTGMTSYLGAHLVIEFLCHICAQPQWAKRSER